jgi:hypothetical protein
MKTDFKDNYESALWAIATGEIKGEPHNHADALQIARDIAQEALGDKWDAYLLRGKSKADANA